MQAKNLFPNVYLIVGGNMFLSAVVSDQEIVLKLTISSLFCSYTCIASLLINMNEEVCIFLSPPSKANQ